MTTDELISRKAALEATCNNCCDNDDCTRGCADYMEIVNIPAVEVKEVVHAKWNYDGSCGNCGVQVLSNYMYFCPHCGADMRGVENG